MKVRKFTQLVISVVLVLFVWISCVKEELDLENVSRQIELNPNFYAPIVKGSLTCSDMFEDKFTDSTLILKGDSINFYLKEDSIFLFDIRDFIEMPNQGSYHYDIEQLSDTVFASEGVYELEQVETFSMVFPNNMQVDSMFLNTGTLHLDMNSTFSSLGAIQITIPSLFINNRMFDSVFSFTRTTDVYGRIHEIPLTNAKIIVDNSTGSPFVEMHFKVVQPVSKDESIGAHTITNLDITFMELNDFEYVFGYAGDMVYDHDTIIDTELEVLEGISGTFAITNPKIKLNYTHTFGFPVGFDLEINGVFDGGNKVVLQPSTEVLKFSPDYKNPLTKDQIVFNRVNISNIDEFLVFPPPVQVGYIANAAANPGSFTGLNYALGDSKFILGMEVEIPLEFRANLTLRDTLNLDLGFEDSDDEIDYVEYARLNYQIRNEFPINFDASIILYDSINDIKYDTIDLNEGDEGLITAAPVDANGISIINQVEELRGSILLTKDEIYNLLNNANKIILVAKISSTDPLNVPSVKILNYYKFNFKTFLECEILYKGSLK